MENNKLFGGVEGGATHSNLVICNAQGEVIGRAKGPGTNHWNLGIDECASRVVAMLEAAKDNAGIPRDQPLDSLGLTLSGCEQDSTNLELANRVLEKHSTCSRAVFVASDTAGSLFTGAPGEGMVVIAGTGSNALLRTADGKQYGCGGWGYLLGDEGGAYWIAHRAVKTFFDDVDGLRQSPYPTEKLWAAVKEHFQVESRLDLLQHAYSHFDKSKFAGLTAKISTLAQSGDPLSIRLFSDAGEYLALHIAALCRHTDVDKMRVVCVGSVWNSWESMRIGMLKVLRGKGLKKELHFVRLRVSSAMGAAWLAAKHVNYDLPRDDSAFCEVFFTYHPELTNGEITNGEISNGEFTNGEIINGEFINGEQNGVNNNRLANGNSTRKIGQENCTNSGDGILCSA